MTQDRLNQESITAVAAERPRPRPDDVTRPFWEACERRTLCFQQCTECGHRWLPASVVCPRCWFEPTVWIESGGAGIVFSFAVYHRAYHPAFESLLPYVVAVIELTEGPRLISNLIDVSPDQVHVGMAVCLSFMNISGAVLPVFRPAEDPEDSEEAR